MGIHTYFSAAVQLLLAEGGDVTLLANFDIEEFVGDFPGAHWEAFGSRRDIIWDQFSVPSHLRQRSYHYYWAPANNGIPWRSIGSTRSICTTHDLIPLRLPRMYLRGEPGFAIPYFVWTLSGVLRSDVLITVSRSSAHDIRKLFRRTSLVISSALTLPSGTGQVGTSLYGLRGHDYLIYTGGMDSRKNVKNLLAGFALSRAKLPNLRLVIIGNRTELIQPLIDSLNLSDRVVLTGFVTDDEKVALLEGAKAMAYPSLYEGLGLPILEAFAVGVPVLTCRNSSLFEVAGDAAIYVEPLSPTSIAEGIVEIFNEGVADRLRSLGHRRLEVHATVVARQQLVNLFATNPSPQVSRRRWRKQFNSNHKTPIDG